MATIQEKGETLALRLLQGSAQNHARAASRIDPGRQRKGIVEAEIGNVADVDVALPVELACLSHRAGGVLCYAVFPLGLPREHDLLLHGTVLHQIEVLLDAWRIRCDLAF